VSIERIGVFSDEFCLGVVDVRQCLIIIIFCLFIVAYSTALPDYGGALFIQVSRLRSARGGTLEAPLCPLPRPPMKCVTRTNEILNEKDKGNDKRNCDPPSPVLILACGCNEGGRE